MLAKSRGDASKLAQSSHLPFLYFTPTILLPTPPQSTRSFSDTQPQKPRNPRPPVRRYNVKPKTIHKVYGEEPQRSQKRVVDIPFERPQREQRDGYAELELEGSTITPNERKAFEGLFRLRRGRETGNQREGKRMQNEAGNMSGIKRQIGGPESNPEESSILDKDGRRRVGMPAALQKIATEAQAMEGETTTTNRGENPSLKPARNQQDLDFSHAAQKDLHTILKALGSAQTDAAIWHILQTRIFQRLNRKTTPRSRENNITSPDDSNILEQTLPIHLINTFTHLLESFPTSNLPLSILPTLHQLGPEAVSLGASTKLYNLHLRLLFEKYPTSLPSILSILREADHEPGWQYDEETVEVLDDVLVYAREVQEGKFGEAVRVVWGMERMVRTLREIVKVRNVAVERVQRGAVLRAREKEWKGEVLMN